MTKHRTILVTGGAGYIGSHACLVLLEAGYEVVVIDNLCNSKADSLGRVEELTGRAMRFLLGDLRDRLFLKHLFEHESIDAVVHFAGLKAVGESTKIPLDYYQNNIGGTANLLEEMDRAGVRDIVFSSSCTVYGTPDELPIREDFRRSAVNPYGRTKLAIEYMLQDLAAAEPAWNISILRYFNPVGAHPSGDIGEDPLGVPNNLMPYITQVAVGELRQLSVFGDDYDTPDGTCVRDYIHVMDLAEAHVAALRKLEEKPNIIIHNVGTGRGYSVLEIVRAFGAATGRDVRYEITGRRAGDAPAVYADVTLAESELGWKATRSLDEMCRDAWNWQRKNPRGYE